jgi:HEAT repeat protein
MLAHLEVAIHDHSPAVRCQAIRALGEVGSPEQLQSLIPFLQVEDQAVRLAVVRALGSIGGDDAVGALVKLGSDNDLVVRWEAQAAVNRLLSGDKTSPSRPRLVPEQSPPVTFLD